MKEAKEVLETMITRFDVSKSIVLPRKTVEVYLNYREVLTYAIESIKIREGLPSKDELIKIINDVSENQIKPFIVIDWKTSKSYSFGEYFGKAIAKRIGGER